MDTLRQYGWFAAGALLLLGGLAAPEGYDVMVQLAGALAVCVGFVLQSARRGTLATAVVAFGANAYLYTRKLESAAGDSRCNINAVFNCDVVNTSAASEMFGLPITLFGMAFYLGLIVAAMMHPRNTPRFFQISGLFSIASLIYSAWLAWESKRIGAVCVVCISIYVSNALLLWAAVRGLKDDESSLFDDIGQTPMAWTTLVIFSTFVMVTLIGANHWRSQNTGGLAALPQTSGGGGSNQVDPNDPDVLKRLYAETRGPVTLDGTEPLLGRADAPYQLIEFADFGCPHCARASQEVAQLVKEDPDFAVRFKVFPLTSACNPGVERDTGPERCRAAAAAECGRLQSTEKFWELSHLIFVNQTLLDDDSLFYMAEQSGLDMAAFKACMEDPAVMEGIRADAMSGLRAGLFGTPSFYMQGTHGETWVEVPSGVQGAYLLGQAHKNGVQLPPPGPPMQP